LKKKGIQLAAFGRPVMAHRAAAELAGRHRNPLEHLNINFCPF
jgi:hypothetical protein